MKMHKKGATDFMQLILVIAVVVLVVNVVKPDLFAGVDAEGKKVASQVIEVKSEPACGSTTMTVDFVKKYAEATDLTAQNATVYINGGRKGLYSEGGTFTAQGGDTLNTYNALDPAQTTYYASHATGVVPCTGQTAAFMTSADFMKKGALSGIAGAAEVYAGSTNPSFSVINLKDYTSNPGTALALGAGAKETARVAITWTSKEAVGPADGNTLACRFTDSQIDQANVVTTLDGTPLVSPAKYNPSSSIFAVGAVNQTIKTWSMPAIDGSVRPSSTLDLLIAADANNNPPADTNVSCEIIDTDLFELDAGGVGVGVEDPDSNANVGRSSNSIFHVLLS